MSVTGQSNNAVMGSIPEERERGGWMDGRTDKDRYIHILYNTHNIHV